MFNQKQPVLSPVLLVDALGITDQIATRDTATLQRLAESLEEQYYKFRAKVPHRLVIVTKQTVFGTKEFTTLRMNDMFVLFSERRIPDAALRYLVSVSLLYYQSLLSNLIPRGALGYGLVLRKKDMILGSGFVDAYRYAEERSAETKDVCAIEVSPEFIGVIPNTEQAYRLICLYKDRFFLNPRALVDPDLGEFDSARVMTLLRQANTNQEKLTATSDFLENLEDYDAALQLGSRSRKLTGWRPRSA